MVAPMVIAGLAGLVMGAMSAAEKRKAREKMLAYQRPIEQMRERFSHWTGRHGETADAPAPSYMGEMMQGGATGLAMGQNMSAADSVTKNNDAQTAYYQSHTKQPDVVNDDTENVYLTEPPPEQSGPPRAAMVQQTPHGIEDISNTAQGRRKRLPDSYWQY